MDWLEISITTNGELAEAVAEVLARFCENGVVMEQGIRHVNDVDAGTPAGPITVRAYVPAGGAARLTRGKIEEALGYLGMIQPLPAAQFRLLKDQDWMEAWKSHYHPIPIGDRLMIVPAWMEPPDADRMAVRIDPGMAFGTGTHPSTQLCLELIEALLGQERTAPRRPPDVRATGFIDVGCGSGILAIAALKMGAGTALAVDVDPQAAQNTRANAALNGIGDELVVGVGSVAEILAGNYGPSAAPLAVANILAPVIVQLFDVGLADLVSPAGSLILAGILDSQAETVEAAARKFGMTTQERRRMGDWLALVVSR